MATSPKNEGMFLAFSALNDHWRGIKYYEEVKFKEAKEYFRKAADKRKSALGEEHVDTLHSTFMFGRTLYELGENSEAVKVLQYVTALRQKRLGGKHEDTITSKHWLGLVLCELGKYSDAEESLRSVVEGRERIFGKNDKRTLDGKSRFATTLYLQGKYSEARIPFQDAVVGGARFFGRNHEQTLASKHGLGLTLLNLGEFKKAKANLQQVAKGRERLFSINDERTLQSKHGLGRALFELGEFGKAKVTLQQVTEVRGRLLGIDNGRTLQSKYRLGLALLELGEYENAREALQHVSRNLEAHLGHDDEDTLESKHWLAIALCKLGKHSEAITLFQDAAKGRKRLLTKHCFRTARSKFWLGTSFFDLGMYDEAEELLQCVVLDSQSEEFDGVDQFLLGRTLFHLGKYGEAKPYFSHAAEIRECGFGGLHEGTLRTKFWLGRTHFELKDYDEAETILQRTLEGCETTGKCHADSVACRYWLGRTFYNAGNYAAAALSFERVAEDEEETLGTDHENTLESKHWLELALAQTGESTEHTAPLQDLEKRPDSSFAERSDDVINVHSAKDAELTSFTLPMVIPKTSSQQRTEPSPEDLQNVQSSQKQSQVIENPSRSLKSLDSDLSGELPGITKPQVPDQEPREIETRSFQNAKTFFSRSTIVNETRQSLTQGPSGVEGDPFLQEDPGEFSFGSKYKKDAKRSSLPAAAIDEAPSPPISSIETESLKVKEDPLSITFGNNTKDQKKKMKGIGIEETSPPAPPRRHTKPEKPGEKESCGSSSLGNVTVTKTKRKGKEGVIGEIVEETKVEEGVRIGSSPKLTTINIPQVLEDRLGSFFSGNMSNQNVYTDGEISEISAILKHSNIQWSEVPRAYIVLRTIGHLSQLDDLIKAEFSDLLFPVTELQLPGFLSPGIKASFVKAQSVVLSNSFDLEKGVHCSYKRGESPPLETRGILGRGGYGQVDRVISLISFKEYARKQVPRGRMFRGQQKQKVQQFITEIKILKRLEHHHIVKFLGSYTDSQYICLLMSPVAEMDLRTYLSGRPRSSELRTFFGCLATALEYLHSCQVRHKDMKPQNILVKYGQVFLTDFGLSFDFTDAEGSTTVSLVNGLTWRYCPPEVALHEPRNTASDIWSLGVVFLEMAAILKGKTMQHLDEFYKESGPWQSLIRTEPLIVSEFYEELEGMGDPSDSVVFDWTREMLSLDQSLRPTASSLAESITGPDIGGFCGICCTPSVDDLSDWEDD